MTEQITRINQYTLKIIHKQMAEALSIVSDELNVRFAIETGRYYRDGSSGKISITVFPEDAMTVLQTDGQLIWNQFCVRYGLTPHDYGREFTTHSGRYKLTGFKPQNKKYPVIAEKLTHPKKGGSFKFPATVVRDALK